MQRFILLILIFAAACTVSDTDGEIVSEVANQPTIQVNTPIPPTASAEPIPTNTAAPTQPATGTPATPTTESTAAPAAVTPTTESTTSLPILISEPPILAQSIALLEIAGGLDRLVYMTHAGDDRLFTVAAEGLIYVIQDGGVVDVPFLDISDRVNDGASEQGLLSIAFHPDYANNSRFFVYYTDDNNATVVSEFSASGNKADPNSERIILTVPQPYRNHNGGQLQFGDDGYLYIGLGDGGSGGDPDNNGQNPQTLLGSILRIDIDSAEPYAIPADNPFVDDPNAANEIWTYGWRNPWRFSFDRATGDMYIGDVGQNAWEEISFESADSLGGGNYGWNVYEGFHCFVNDCESILPDAVPPILEYGRNEGCSITGGYIYRGAALPALNGNYLFGDFCTGTIWASTQPNERVAVLDSGLSISSFGEDAAGELYVLDIGGTLYQIVGSD